MNKLENNTCTVLTIDMLDAVNGGYVSEWGENYEITEKKRFELEAYLKYFCDVYRLMPRYEMKMVLRKAFISDSYAKEYPDVLRYIDDLVNHVYDSLGRP